MNEIEKKEGAKIDPDAILREAQAQYEEYYRLAQASSFSAEEANLPGVQRSWDFPLGLTIRSGV